MKEYEENGEGRREWRTGKERIWGEKRREKRMEKGKRIMRREWKRRDWEENGGGKGSNERRKER